MHRNPSRPLSPFTTVTKFGPHVYASFGHRVTGIALATVGMGLFTWWLAATADGPEAYGAFVSFATSWFGILILAGLSWAFWFKTLMGLRHIVMDIGAGYELGTNKLWAIVLIISSFVLTALTWVYILWVR
jgi:succinate dehydrogenase / fumarate reductase, cytochrome b subunit